MVPSSDTAAIDRDRDAKKDHRSNARNEFITIDGIDAEDAALLLRVALQTSAEPPARRTVPVDLHRDFIVSMEDA